MQSTRVTSLDGLRGLAIALVLADHFLSFDQGWIGVDVFFVLSGYLITAILLTERGESRYWRMFYTRRVTRIAPAFLLLLGGFGFLYHTKPFLVLWPYLLLFGANFANLKHHVVMEAAGVGVLWSLAVEEHFYFIWPLQVRFFRRRTLAFILSLILFMSPIARTCLVLYGVNWRWTYFITPFRLDGLAAGALLAIALSNERYKTHVTMLAQPILICSMLATVLVSHFLVFNSYVLFCSAAGYSLLALTSASAIAFLVTTPHSRLGCYLSFRPLVWLGQVSYGVYLYHLLIRNVLVKAANEHGYLHNERIGVFSLGVTLIVTGVSFYFVESPIVVRGRQAVHHLRDNPSIVKA